MSDKKWRYHQTLEKLAVALGCDDCDADERNAALAGIRYEMGSLDIL